jgi:hypothetical protein
MDSVLETDAPPQVGHHARREPRLTNYPSGPTIEEGDWFVWGEGPRATLSRVRLRKGEENGPWYVVWDEGYGYMTVLEIISVVRDDYAVFSPDMGDLAQEEYEMRRDTCDAP